MKDFTAEDARSMFKSKTDEQLNTIIDEIKKVASEKDNICWEHGLTPQVEKILKERGFTVKYESHRNESHHIISW